MNIKSEVLELLRCPICGKVCSKKSGASWMTRERFVELNEDDERVAKGDITFEAVHCHECAEAHASGDETVFDDGDDATDTGNGDRTRDR